MNGNGKIATNERFEQRFINEQQDNRESERENHRYQQSSASDELQRRRFGMCRECEDDWV